MNIFTPQAPYRHIWHKYRPAILRLMVNAEHAPQQYVFSDHEFKRIFPKNRSSLAFTLCLHRSKALNNIRTSPLAHALLVILQESKTAVQLTEASAYELRFDEKFVLHVQKTNSKDHTSATAVSLEKTPV